MAPYLRAVPVAQYRNLFSSSSVALCGWLWIWIPSCAMCRGLVGLNPIVYYLSDVDSDLLITVPIKIGLFFKEADSDLLITVPIKIGLFFKEAEEHGGGKS
jgi:hypothetical protein